MSDIIPAGTFAELTGSQVRAIKLGIELGELLAREVPEIADNYRSGLSVANICDKYHLSELLGVPRSIAANAVTRALWGYDGSFGLTGHDPYEGLITDPAARARLAAEHNAESGRIVGERAKRDKTGIHAHTPAERREVGRIAALARGGCPFSNEEIHCVVELINLPEYQRRSRIHAQRIAAELNRRFYEGGDVRRPRQVTKLVCRMKRRVE